MPNPGLHLARILRAHCLASSIALACTSGLAGCSDDAAHESGPTDEASAQIGKGGGTLKTKDVTLVIPADALDGDVEITIKNKGFTAPADLDVKQASDVFEFGPSGTKFKKDVEVQFHTDKDDAQQAVYFTKENSTEFEKIASEKRAGEPGKGPDLVAKTSHFSEGFVGVPNDALDGGSQPTPTGDGGALDGGAGDAAPDGGPAPQVKHVVVLSKDRFGLAVNQTWAAFQDADGAWQPLAASSTVGIYQFDVTGSRYAVAFICANAAATASAGSIWLEPSTTSTLEVESLGTDCDVGTAAAEHYDDGTLNLGSATVWRYGSALETGGEIVQTGTTTAKFAHFVHQQPNDLLLGSGTGNLSLTRLLFDRDITLSADASGSYRDMVKQGTAVTANLSAQASNASALTTVDVRYTTRGTEDGLWLNTAATLGTSTRSAQFAVVPDAMRVATDRYLLLADEQDTSAWRTASVTAYAPNNLGVALPAAFPVTFSSAATPYLRPTYAFTPTADAEHYIFNMIYQVQRSFSHDFVITLAPGWLGGATNASVSFPDFSQVTGFNLAWVPPGVLPQGQTVNLDGAVQTRKADAASTVSSVSGQRQQLKGP
ncbi:MAG: hypothetical protein QM778_20165 [Myxococcales bacterium]